MKIKTNIRAGAKSGTAPSGKGADNAAGSESVDVVTAPVVVYTRCAGY